MCHETGRQLHELMGWEGPATWRQLETWKVWLRAQWNQPSRTDHYLMQVAAEIRRANAKEPKEVHDEHFRIEFREREVKRPEQAPPAPSTPAEKSAASRAIWGAAIHGKKRPK